MSPFSPKTAISRRFEASLLTGFIKCPYVSIVTLTFKGDGSLDINGWIDVGTYTISGNQITLLDINCGTDEGIYTYSINENTLNFALIADSCYGRTTVIPGDWESVLIASFTQLSIDTLSDKLLQTNALWLSVED
jgi:hypothetical protein